MYDIYDLECDGMFNPIGITNAAPQFSWKLVSDENGNEQKAYSVTIRDEEGNEIWNSGEQFSKVTFGIEYTGNPLKSGYKYTWTVKSIDSFGKEAVSEEAYFTTGLLEPGQWHAKWIEADCERKPLKDCTDVWKIFSEPLNNNEDLKENLNPPVYFRREIKIEKTVRKAFLYATAHGVYTVEIDGEKISEILAPGFTKYDKLLELQQYDVSEALSPGKHTISVILADGWYTGKIGLLGIGEQFGRTNAFACQLNISYWDGTSQELVSDKSFKWNFGGFEYADLFIGEAYNETKEPYAWKLCGYDDTEWKQPKIGGYTFKNLVGRMCEPVREVHCFEPESILLTPKGELVIDAGINTAGYVRVTVDGREGQKMSLVHSEVLDDKGNFFFNIIGQNKNQTDTYVFAENHEVMYSPSFTFHGFRYVKVERIAREQIRDVRIIVIATDMQKTGIFGCSDMKLNRLQGNIFRSQQSNMISIPMDCPQRERAGWTGDMQVYMPTACYNMDVLAFLKKWLMNMRMEQSEDGEIPNIVPDFESNHLLYNSLSEPKNFCSAGWGDACVIVPYVLYRYYADESILKDNYTMMLRWMAYVENQAATSFPKPLNAYPEEARERQKYLWNTGFHFGDWLFPSQFEKGYNQMEAAEATKAYMATAMYAHTTSLMSRIAAVLKDEDRAEYYEGLNRKIRKVFCQEYVDAQGHLPIRLQGLYVMALKMNMVSGSKKDLMVDNLVQMIHENNDCLDTGFLSVPYLLDVLCDNGESKLAYKILNQTKAPSWLYAVEHGATTIWENWTAILPDGTRTKTSYNHFAFGCVGDFIYRRILGITALNPGYEKIRIMPDTDCGLTKVYGTFQSVYGEIEVSWEFYHQSGVLKAVLPPGVSGELVFGGNRITVGSGSHEMIWKP